MIINILLIDNNFETRTQILQFIDELGVKHCHVTKEYSHAIDLIDHVNPDLIICNPDTLEESLKYSFSKKIQGLSIPLLWLIAVNDNSRTKILLKYNVNA